MQETKDRLIVCVQTRSELDAALDTAVDRLQPAATARGVGIRVTRLAPGRYEAALDRLVAHGTIVEKWDSLPDPR